MNTPTIVKDIIRIKCPHCTKSFNLHARDFKLDIVLRPHIIVVCPLCKHEMPID